MNSQPVLTEAEIEAQRKDMLVPIRTSDDTKTAAWAIEENRQINTLCDMAEAYRASLDSGAVEAVKICEDLGNVAVTQDDMNFAAGCFACAQAIRRQALSPTTPSTAKESLMVGGEEDENRLIEQRTGERRKIGFPWGDFYAAVGPVSSCVVRRPFDRRHPSAEPINAAQPQGGAPFSGPDSQESSAHGPAAGTAPASGQAEAMREADMQACRSVMDINEDASDHNQACADCEEAIRALPLPPESEADGLLDAIVKESIGRREKLEAAEAALAAVIVKVDKEGVQFGKWCWISHEKITGCEAALIPTKHKQYYKWFLANLSAKPAASEPVSGAEELRNYQHEVIQAAYRPRPMCRDCADRDGTCYDGKKCDPFEAALDTLRIYAKLSKKELAVVDAAFDIARARS